jgi:ribosomal protein S14
MKYLYWKDKKRRVLFASYEEGRVFLRAVVKNFFLSGKLRVSAYSTSNLFPRDASITRLHNRCSITNRTRGIYTKFGLSRLMFRKYAWKGKLTGVKKSSW